MLRLSREPKTMHAAKPIRSDTRTRRPSRYRPHHIPWLYRIRRSRNHFTLPFGPRTIIDFSERRITKLFSFQDKAAGNLEMYKAVVVPKSPFVLYPRNLSSSSISFNVDAVARSESNSAINSCGSAMSSAGKAPTVAPVHTIPKTSGSFLVIRYTTPIISA